MRNSDWSSYVCSSDLRLGGGRIGGHARGGGERVADRDRGAEQFVIAARRDMRLRAQRIEPGEQIDIGAGERAIVERLERDARSGEPRSEEHTSELQSLMRISYAVFCLKQKQQQPATRQTIKNNHNNK